MVNHPEHYEKSSGNRYHPECIELLELLTEGFSGVLALDIGQLKYLYRFGSKKEDGMTISEKAVQDLQKVLWYANDFKKRLPDYLVDFAVNGESNKRKILGNFIAEEFAFDKPEKIKSLVRNVVKDAWNIPSSKQHLDENVDIYITDIEKLIEAVKLLEDKDWI